MRLEKERKRQNKYLPAEEDGERQEGQFSESSADTGKDHPWRQSHREAHLSESGGERQRCLGMLMNNKKGIITGGLRYFTCE